MDADINVIKFENLHAIAVLGWFQNLTFLLHRGDNIWGFKTLGQKDLMKVQKGNMDAQVSIDLINIFRHYGVPITMENGDQSMIWFAPGLRELLLTAKVFKVDYCCMGRAYRKRTRLAAWALPNEQVAHEVSQECAKKYHCSSKGGICDRTKEPHLILRGWSRGKALTADGKVYPKKFANLVTKLTCTTQA